jgi:hypothetical protein
MKIKIDQPKSLILPIVLFLSLCLNLLYLFNMIDFKIYPAPPKTQELQNHIFKTNYIDAPIERRRNIDSINKLKIIPGDMHKIK